MDYMKSDFFYNKCLWAIAYCKNPLELSNYLVGLFGIDVDSMYVALDSFSIANGSLLTETARKNLLVFVKTFKSICAYNFTDIEKRICDDSFSLIDGFILSQYEKRFMYESAPLELINEKNKKAYFEFLKSMLVNDMNVLITHSYRCDSRTFCNVKAKQFVNDNALKYIGSVNMITSEYPQILNDELFTGRVNFICDLIDDTPKTDNVQKIYTMFKNKNGL